MRIALAALVCIVVAAVNLAQPYVTFPPLYLRAANLVLLATALYLLVRGFSLALKKRAEDIGAPHLLCLRSEAEKRAAELKAMEAKVRQLENDLGLARRREAEAVQRKASTEGAEAQIISFISMLQSKGRFLDFLMDDITPYDDAQVGAASRVVHQGCLSVIREYLDISPVGPDQEGAPITLDKDFDPKRYRLVGKVSGQPPYRGVVLHRGWMTTRVKLPRLVAPAEAHHEREVIAPAEIELA